MQPITLGELPPLSAGNTGWPWTEESPQLPDAMPDGSPWPRVSIVTPSFNQARFLEETIRSVLLQGYPNLEYIIIDGGSTDGSVEIIRRYERWLAYWVSEPDEGQSHALNKGFAKATGEVVAWLNSDDAYAPQALARAVPVLASDQSLGAVFGDCNFVDSKSQVTGVYRGAEFDLTRQLFGNPVPQPSVFMRRRALVAAGGINTRRHYALDYDLWFRLGLRHRLSYLPEVLSTYRIWEDSKSVQSSVRFLEEYLPIFDELYQRKDLGDELVLARPMAYGLAHVRLGFAYVQQGDESRAEQHFDQALAWSESDIDRIPFLYVPRRVVQSIVPVDDQDCFKGYAALGETMRKRGVTWPPAMRRFLSSYRTGIAMEEFARSGNGRQYRRGIQEAAGYSATAILNLGVWSLFLESLVGPRGAGLVRQMGRVLLGKGSENPA